MSGTAWGVSSELVLKKVGMSVGIQGGIIKTNRQGGDTLRKTVDRTRGVADAGDLVMKPETREALELLEPLLPSR